MDFQNFSLFMKYAREYGHSRIRDAGISDTEHIICAFLCFHSEVSQDYVAGALKMDKTTVAKALLSLEKKDFVCRERNPENRRKNSLSITEKGRLAVADLLHIYDSWLADVMSCLSEKEQAQFGSYCVRILENAEKLSEEEKQ